MTNTLRAWLISALTHQPLPLIAEYQVAELVEAAENEGVLLLLEQQLQRHPEQQSLSVEFTQALVEAARPLVFGQMQMLAEQRRVFDVLQQAQVDFLVMKGGALAHWLYEKPHLRIVTDLDILLPDKKSVLAAEPVLQLVGYQSAPAAGEMISYEHPFMKTGGPYGVFTVDAHWRLFNGALLADCFHYAELREQAMELPGRQGVFGLCPVHAFFNACGHRALNMPFKMVSGLQRADSLRWLWDIHAMALQFIPSQWQQVLQLARLKGLSGVVLDALLKIHSEFGTSVPENVIGSLRQCQPAEAIKMRWFETWPRYQYQVFFASSNTWAGRFKWLAERVWPNPDAMRDRYGKHDPVWMFMLKRVGAGLKRLFR